MSARTVALHETSDWDPRGRRHDAALALSRALWLATSLAIGTSLATLPIARWLVGYVAVAPDGYVIEPGRYEPPPLERIKPAPPAARPAGRSVLPNAIPVPVPAGPDVAVDVPSPSESGRAASGPPVPGGEGDGAEVIPDARSGLTEAPIIEYPDVDPLLLKAERIEYPDMARDAGVEGTVVLRLLIGLGGEVEQVILARSVPLLDSAAVQSVRRWRYAPARMDGQPVRARVIQPVRFRLHD